MKGNGPINQHEIGSHGRDTTGTTHPYVTKKGSITDTDSRKSTRDSF